MSRLAIITFITRDGADIDNGLPAAPGYPGNALPGGGPVDPGFGRPGWSPVDPGFGAGRPNRPDNSLPGGGHIALLPVFPFDPTKPDNELPGPGGGDTMPIRPGAKFVVKWLACQGLILVPDNELPPTGPTPTPTPTT